LIARRVFDVAVAGVALAAVLLPMAVIALAIRLGSRGPAFFRQERVGLNGRRFRIWKLRTMVSDAPAGGSLVTAAGDARITPLGRVLRRWKVDELPQLINVLTGEMSLVGPRPEVARYVALYSDEQRRVLSVPPGMTDPASLEYADEEQRLEGTDDIETVYVREVMPRKLELNLRYIDERTFGGDLKLILRTIARIILGRRR
jgi:lipopolysaccharide/colanic/teichoic acid biosynthesis glycosyltransferase